MTKNAFLLEILYTIFNRSTCEVKTVEQRIGELQLARRDTDITVPVSLKSVLAPDSIDLTHGSYVVMDGVYHAYLIVPSDGYNPRVVAGWTSILVNAGEGIDVDFYFSREPKERIQAKLGQQIRINRSRLKDTSDTNSDFVISKAQPFWLLPERRSCELRGLLLLQHPGHGYCRYSGEPGVAHL